MLHQLALVKVASFQLVVGSQRGNRDDGIRPDLVGRERGAVFKRFSRLGLDPLTAAEVG